MPDQLHDRAINLLLDTVEAGRYPSVAMLDRLEAHISDRQTAERYVELLLDRISQDTYPSPTLLERVLKLIALLEAGAATQTR